MTRAISWFISSFYLAIVAVLVSVHVLNPDGDVSGAPAMVLTLPWSIILAVRNMSLLPATLLIVFGGAINAVVLLLFIAAPDRRFEWPLKVGTLIVIGAVLGTLAWLMNDAEVNNLIRIARDGPAGGIYVAVDDNGLRVLSEAIGSKSPFLPSQTARGLLFVRRGTKGRYRGHKLLFKGGRLVEPSSASQYHTIRDGAIEVERIKIMEGPNKGLEGWVQIENLQRVLGLYAL